MIFTVSLTTHEANEVLAYLESKLTHTDIKAGNPAVHSGLLKICEVLANKGADNVAKGAMETIQSNQK